jgi:hypothetical protein
LFQRTYLCPKSKYNRKDEELEELEELEGMKKEREG